MAIPKHPAYAAVGVVVALLISSTVLVAGDDPAQTSCPGLLQKTSRLTRPTAIELTEVIPDDSEVIINPSTLIYSLIFMNIVLGFALGATCYQSKSSARKRSTTSSQPTCGKSYHWHVGEQEDDDKSNSLSTTYAQVSSSSGKVDFNAPLTVVIFGATGDLAKKKLFPALYQLMYAAPSAPLLPLRTRIVGFGRSPSELGKFIEKQCGNVKGEKRDEYLKKISYFQGGYDNEADFARLDGVLKKLEGASGGNRLYFLSVPPTIFGDVCKQIKSKACAASGFYTRLIIEKPFGRDSASFAALDGLTSSLFREDQIYRIDHYLGKEVVLNMVALRFGNQFLEPLWNRDNIESVQIIFKEDLGTGGRGGYFDGFGIVRDIMQNHLLQVFLWLAMEPPTVLDVGHIAEKKVELLKSVRTLQMKDCFLGQFSANSWQFGGKAHTEPGYLDDPTVPAGSTCPTYAAVVLGVDNERWRGVPFVMRAGKGLDERMSEVRVTFKKKAYNAMVPGEANELVMRIQPDESIYMKCMNKQPGFEKDVVAPVCLDMSYKKNFAGVYVADAYERMFLNTAKGDQSLFVGNQELTEAWRIFTPLLDEIDKKKPQPVLYPFGSRVPPGMDEFMGKYNITMGQNWEEFLALRGKTTDDLKALFMKLDTDKSGYLTFPEVKEFAKTFYDCREPPDDVVARVIGTLDEDGDGQLSLEEVMSSVHKMQSWLDPKANTDHS